MPEIFDQNHDWVGVLNRKNTFVYLLCRAIYRVTLALFKRQKTYSLLTVEKTKIKKKEAE